MTASACATPVLHVGLDVGSTTVKLVVIRKKARSDEDPLSTAVPPPVDDASATTPAAPPNNAASRDAEQEYEIVFSVYKRHFFDVRGAVVAAFEALSSAILTPADSGDSSTASTTATSTSTSSSILSTGDTGSEVENRGINGPAFATVCITGSAGTPLATALDFLYVQEVVACAEAVQVLLKNMNIDVAIELGGEDAKILRFSGSTLDAQMNSTCAAGTGAFIDQMATLLETDAAGLNKLASAHKTIYSIAPRCGVFAKADVQPLLSEGVAREDIAMSILNAVVVQTISGLACGKALSGRILLLGGPMNFLHCLRERFAHTLFEGGAVQVLFPTQAHQVVCGGAAAYSRSRMHPTPLSFICRRVLRLLKSRDFMHTTLSPVATLGPLFQTPEDLNEFRARHSQHVVQRIDINEVTGPLFLGIDSGSTTLKLALITPEGKLVHSYYDVHRGHNLQHAINALTDMLMMLEPHKTTFIAGCGVTGYGENLLKAAFRADVGVVETIAHLRAAQFFQPETDVLLDIGGQDMKCMRIGPDGVISEVLLNEACSSGCGSFIQTLAGSLQTDIEKFVDYGLKSRSPLDLGNKCTVFMNSRIKQAQRDGASIEDMSAGVAISVIKNALFKVMRINSAQDLGRHVVVQGGTFLNDAILRALEMILQCNVVRPDIAPIMGAFGAALVARNGWQKSSSVESSSRKSSMLSLSDLKSLTWESINKRCGKCHNNCLLTIHRFDLPGLHNEHVSGNRCVNGLGEEERHQLQQQCIPNLFEWQRKRVFTHVPLSTPAPYGQIGIPRALQFYDEFPMWEAVFRTLGFQVILSRESSDNLFRMGMSSMPIESCCSPVKILHGHITDLIQRRVPLIVFPCEPLSENQYPATTTTEFTFEYGGKLVYYQCPLLSGYHDVIKNNMEFGSDSAFLHVVAPLFNPQSAVERLYEQLAPKFPKITKRDVELAFQAGYAAQKQYRAELEKAGENALSLMRQRRMQGVVVACRPYQLDPWTGSSTIPNILTAHGYAVFSSDSVAHLGAKQAEVGGGGGRWRLLNLFANDSRILAAAKFVSRAPDLALIHLVSFGCSIAPETDDEIKALFHHHQRPHCCIKLDQNTNAGTLRVRVRSLLAALDEHRDRSRALIYPAPLPMLRPIFTTANCCPKAPRSLVYMNFSREHTELYSAAFNVTGCKAIPCPDISEDARNEVGLKYVHPDACYGATIIVGTYLYVLFHGMFDPDTTDFMWIHMGGSCTAHRMMWFVRDALDKAGFSKVSLYSIDCSATVNPGYTVGQTLRLNMSLAWGDALSQVLYRTRPYEATPGSVNNLYTSWVQRAKEHVASGNPLSFSRMVTQMVADFDSIPLKTETHDKPRVGLVGLMCKADPIKYNWLLKFLEEQELCEVSVFFFTEYSELAGYNNLANHQLLAPDRGKWFGGKAAQKIIRLFRNPMIKALTESKRFIHPLPFDQLAQLVSKFTSTLHQAGEGWVIVAQILQHLENGINNIILTSPFGCLPIHVGGRGMLKVIRQHYPNANLCVIDYDPSASFVNQLNRIKLMLGCAKDAKPDLQLHPICKPSDIEDAIPYSKTTTPPPPPTSTTGSSPSLSPSLLSSSSGAASTSSSSAPSHSCISDCAQCASFAQCTL
ncbi:2-hydroxyacyl-CoA dehydratase [Pelomyxa schiedti]|nr:2-hydroxyacyl-CoA dehydratase [Pelomyxa schiedti]